MNGKAGLKEGSHERLACNCDRRHPIERGPTFLEGASITLAMTQRPFILEKIDGVMNALERARPKART